MAAESQNFKLCRSLQFTFGGGSVRGFQETFSGHINHYSATYDLKGNRFKELRGVRTTGDRLDRQSDAAVQFIDHHHKKPFFLYVAYFAPHAPLASTKKRLDRFPGKMPTRRRYALAMISAVDDGVGRIMDRLQHHGIDNNTMIFFIGDNGAPIKLTMEDQSMEFKGGAWDGSKNTPLNGETGMLAEGGIRVPFLARWKGTIPGGQICKTPVISPAVLLTSANAQSPDQITITKKGPSNLMRTIATLLTAAMLLPQLSLAQPRNAEAKMSVLENDQIRFGANLTLGGAITLLSTKDGPNMINSHDWGRQIQMSFYSGPKPFEPKGKKPADHWKQLGWNPIQSGDFGGNTSTILEHRNDGKTIYVKCRPMHWPLNNQPAQCTFECIYKLDGNVVDVTSRLVNARDDKTQYGARSQELPALYSNGPWYKIMTYTGAKPYTGGELTELSHKPENPPFPWNHFQATEEWSALVDTENHGFGVWTPGLQSYLGGFAGKPGSGGPKSSPTGYLAPLHMEILDHNIVYTYKYRLVVGSLGDIRRYVYEHRAPQQGLNFVFKSDRQHWHFRNAADKGMPLKGVWEVQLEQNNPSIISPPFCLDAEMVKTVTIRAAFKTGEPKARLIWTKHGNKKPSPEDVISFPVKPDGITRTYTVQLAGNENWHGTITRLALRPCRKGAEGSRLTLESVRAQ